MPGIYTKLITVDKVDLLVGPYGTNFVAPAMPTIIQHNKMVISYTAIGINRQYNYPKYFSMVPVGQEGVNAFSRGFFEMAAAQKPKPQTVAILAADAEFAQSTAQGAREELKKHGFKLIYDKNYPPSMTDYTPVVRALAATNPDIVYVGAYPPDNVGIVRAANEIGFNPKLFGGAMIGMLITPIKVQLGPVVNGLVISEAFVPSPKVQYAGLADLMKRYQEKAPALKTDPIRLCLRAVRLRGRTDSRPGGDRDQDPRPRQARGLHPQSQVPDRGRRNRLRQGRRMEPNASVPDAIPERRGQQRRAVPRRPQATDPMAARVQDRRDDLPLRERQEEVACLLFRAQRTTKWCAADPGPRLLKENRDPASAG